MSNITLQGNTSGTGTFTFGTSESNESRTLTIPDVAGNVAISDGDTISVNYPNSVISFKGTFTLDGSPLNFNKWAIVNSNTTLETNRNYFANTGNSLTLTLPVDPRIGDKIRVIDNHGVASSNVVTIARNGHLIDGFARNLVINTDRDGVELTYVSAEVGFVSNKQDTELKQFGTQAQGESFGYNSGGFDTDVPGRVTTIDRFPFSSDSNAVDVGDITEARQAGASQSSALHGYVSGGNPAPGSAVSTIDKFLFAVETTIPLKQLFR